MRNSALSKKSVELRKKVIELCVNAQNGHLASCLSCTEILTVIYYQELSDQDRFFLSKGHAAAMLYCIMHDKGRLGEDKFRKFGTDQLYTHPKKEYPGVEVSSGSLGHGLGIAAGMAYGYKHSGRKGKFFVLMGDAECYEGSVWESAMFAGHHKLNNLVGIIDHNKRAATGNIADILEIEPIDKKFQSFHWKTARVNGHDLSQIARALEKARKSALPFLIIAQTVKGKGVKELEDDPLCHTRIPKKI